MRLLESALNRLREWAQPFQQTGGDSSIDLPADLIARYEPSRLLSKHRMKHAIWFEDVLFFYGSDTGVSDLHLLVPNPRQAAALLQRVGYIELPIESPFPDDVRSCRGGLRLVQPDNTTGDGVVLISSSVWGYDLTETLTTKMGTVKLPIPPFKSFLESVMEKWLNIDESIYQCHVIWAMSLASPIEDCYSAKDMNSATINNEDYAKQIRPEFRELHYDIVGIYPKKSPISTYRKREYHAIRCEQIKRGIFTPRAYPTANFPVSMAEYPHLTGLNSDISYLRKGGERKKKNRYSQASLHSIEELGTTTRASSEVAPADTTLQTG